MFWVMLDESVLRIEDGKGEGEGERVVRSI